MNDVELIRLLNNSDKAAFEALYDKYVGMVFNFLQSVLKNEEAAEDHTQWCFMQLWEHRASISSDKNLPAWLYVTARNAAYKEVRRQVTAARYVDHLSQDAIEAGGDRTSMSDVEVVRREMLEAIDKLPEARRRIFMMKTFEKKSVSQIADSLGISQKTVETQIRRAKYALRKHVSELLYIVFVTSLFM